MEFGDPVELAYKDRWTNVEDEHRGPVSDLVHTGIVDVVGDAVESQDPVEMAHARYGG